jgi:AbrB family looped-hinge helix DNA binding protein
MMEVSRSTIGPKGQVTIPIAIRRRLGLEPGDKVSWRVENGAVRLAPERHTLESVAGSVGPPTATEDLEQIIEDAKEERAERTVRKLQG